MRVPTSARFFVWAAAPQAAALAACLSLGLTLGAVASCGSDAKTTASCANPGGPTPGVKDAHCVGLTPQTVDASTCGQSAPAGDAGSTAGSSMDANSIYGNTVYGTQAADDDCKYNVVWHADPICESADVMFYVEPTYLADGNVVTGAQPRLEVFLNDTTPAPNTVQKFTETTPGHYTVGPIRFNAPGQWTIRWHLFEFCSDFSDASPHGHAAFFVTVP